jgi:hypothetical protein
MKDILKDTKILRVMKCAFFFLQQQMHHNSNGI